jgi:hypothetical protein
MSMLLRLSLTGMVAMGVVASPAQAANCDRTCLEGWLDTYLDALVKNDPKAVKLAKNVKYTANGQRLAIGDGLWRTMKARGKSSIVVADVAAQQVAAIVTFEEDGPAGSGGAMGVRLKIRNGQITEIEQREEHKADTLKLMDEAPIRAAFTQTVAPDERMSRAALAKAADDYFEAVQRNDGKGYYPVANDCHRITSGMQATNVPTPAGEVRPDPKTARGPSNQWTCREQFESGLLHFVSRVRDRRVVAIDQDRGLVYAFGYFDHAAGDTRTFKTPDGRTVTAGPTTPFTWSIAEVFKVRKGLIHEIQALELERPYGMISGWSTWEQGMSEKMRDETSAR